MEQNSRDKLQAYVTDMDRRNRNWQRNAFDNTRKLL